MHALGLVLLECLTGRREYEGTGIQAAVARLHRRPVIPHDLVSPAWVRLLLALTDDDPGERPTAAEAAAALRGLTPGGDAVMLAGRPPTVLLPVDATLLAADALLADVHVPRGLETGLAEPARRRRWAVPVAAVLVLVGVVSAASLMLSSLAPASPAAPQGGRAVGATQAGSTETGAAVGATTVPPGVVPPVPTVAPVLAPPAPATQAVAGPLTATTPPRASPPATTNGNGNGNGHGNGNGNGKGQGNGKASVG